MPIGVKTLDPALHADRLYRSADGIAARHLSDDVGYYLCSHEAFCANTGPEDAVNDNLGQAQAVDGRRSPIA